MWSVKFNIIQKREKRYNVHMSTIDEHDENAMCDCTPNVCNIIFLVLWRHMMHLHLCLLSQNSIAVTFIAFEIFIEARKIY